MVPVFHFPQWGPAPANGNDTVQYPPEAGAPSSKATSTTIALAQAVPLPEQTSFNEWTPTNAAGQMAPVAAAPWHGTGMVQYALVPVPVAVQMPQQQQQHNMEMPMSYACFPQQPHMQPTYALPAPCGNNAQWSQCVQVDTQFTHAGLPMCETVATPTPRTEASLDIQG